MPAQRAVRSISKVKSIQNQNGQRGVHTGKSEERKKEKSIKMPQIQR